MRVLIDTVSSAGHAARYARLRRAQQRDSGGRSVVFQTIVALIVWGLPAGAVAAALAATALGRRDLSWVAAAALAATLVIVSVRGNPDIRAFDLLRHRSRAGYVLGDLLRLVPWLAWSGLAVAATLAAAAPEAIRGRWGITTAVAAGLVPALVALRATYRRVARNAGEHAAAVGAFWLAVVVFMSLRVEMETPQERWSTWGAVLVVAGIANVRDIVRSGPLRFALGSLADVLAFAACLAPVYVAFENVRAIPWYVAIGSAGLVTLAVLAPLRAIPGIARRMQVSDTRADDDEPQPAPVTDASRRFALDRSAAGRGLWSARFRYLRAGYFPAWAAETPWWRRALSYLGPRPLAWVVVFRGALLLGVAVWLSTDTVAAPLAVVAAFISSRIGSVDALGLDDQLWLMGVDLRAQVLHGLRCLLWLGVVPALVVGGATMVFIEPLGAAPQLAVAVYIVAILVRVGAPGLWPLQETHRLRLGVLWAAAIGLSFLPGPYWTIEQALTLCVWIGPIAVFALIVRLLRLREPALRNALRSDRDPG